MEVNTQDTHTSVATAQTAAADLSGFSSELKAARISSLDAFWLFELADDGTVIYSRPHIAATNDGRNGLEGQNFFDETFGFIDIAEYRQDFRSFVKSNKAAASFVWRRQAAGTSVNTKVLMTRVYQTGAGNKTGAVMMEIRGCTN